MSSKEFRRIAISLAALMLLSATSGCSTMMPKHVDACHVAVATGGAAVMELGVIVGAMLADCGGECVQRKIREGEPVNEATTHHLATRDRVIGYASPGAVLLGGFGGWELANYICGGPEGSGE